MIVGVSPTADLGVPGWVRPTVAIMQAPDFFPHILLLNQVHAIGSGSGVEIYVQELETLQRNQRTLWQGEIRSQGGFGRTLLHFLSQTVADHPTPGVSRHLHLCLVRRHQITLMNSDHTIYPLDGPPIEVRMPGVARTWAEFAKICTDFSAEATQAK